MNYGLEVGKTLDFPGRYGILQFVVFFFLITGFFIAKQIDTKQYPFRQFLVRRCYSIYPGYWMAAAFCLFLNLSFFHIFEASELFYRSIFLIGSNSNTACLDEWTLYLTVIFIVLSSFFTLSNGEKIYPIVVSVIFIGVFIYNVTQQPILIGATYDLLMRSIPLGSIILGGIIYYMLSHQTIAICKVGACVSIFSMMVFVFLFECVRGLSPYIMVPSYYISAGVTFLLFLGTKSNQIFDKVLLNIAQKSYGIYLLHPTLLKILYKEALDYGIVYSKMLHTMVFIGAFVGGYLMSSVIIKILNPNNRK